MPQNSNKLEWVIVPETYEVIKTQTIKGKTTRSVGYSVVYPDGETGYLIVGKVGTKEWQPSHQIVDITLKWK